MVCAAGVERRRAGKGLGHPLDAWQGLAIGPGPSHDRRGIVRVLGSAAGDILVWMLTRSIHRVGCLCAIAALVGAGACAPAAVAASAAGGESAFGELTEGGKETSTTATTPSTTTKETSTTSTSTSNTTSVVFLGLAAAAILIAVIAFLILRDARRVAPVPDGQATGMGRSGRDPAVTMRKRRAKAKAARRQRKRNR